MNIGDLNRRLVIEKNSPTQDAVNEPVEDWAEFKTLWGSVQFLGGRELEAAQKIVQTASVQFVVRKRDDITEEMRVVFGGRTYRINDIAPIEDGRTFMRLLASRVGNV